jgi:hypothetical protein
MNGEGFSVDFIPQRAMTIHRKATLSRPSSSRISNLHCMKASLADEESMPN